MTLNHCLASLLLLLPAASFAAGNTVHSYTEPTDTATVDRSGWSSLSGARGQVSPSSFSVFVNIINLFLNFILYGIVHINTNF